MTSTNTINLNLNITVTQISQEAFYAIPNSIEKASMIDYPAYLIFAPKNAIYNSAMAGISYDIRTSINEIGKKAFNIESSLSKIMLATASGASGGAFKYAFVGQNPSIGAISTAGYEICGAFKFCSDNPLVYGPVTIAIESFDAAAHAYLRTSDGDIYGAVMQGALGGAKVGATVYGLIQSLFLPGTEALDKAGAVMQGALGGAKVGATVYGLIQSLYLLGTEALHKAESIALSNLSDLEKIIYVGDIDNHAEL